MYIYTGCECRHRFLAILRSLIGHFGFFYMLVMKEGQIHDIREKQDTRKKSGEGGVHDFLANPHIRKKIKSKAKIMRKKCIQEFERNNSYMKLNAKTKRHKGNVIRFQSHIKQR